MLQRLKNECIPTRSSISWSISRYERRLRQPHIAVTYSRFQLPPAVQCISLYGFTTCVASNKPRPRRLDFPRHMQLMLISVMAVPAPLPQSHYAPEFFSQAAELLLPVISSLSPYSLTRPLRTFAAPLDQRREPLARQAAGPLANQIDPCR